MAQDLSSLKWSTPKPKPDLDINFTGTNHPRRRFIQITIEDWFASKSNRKLDCLSQKGGFRLD